nr:MAG TPA: hypothetical protein [Caudoviricetes sp.]
MLINNVIPHGEIHVGNHTVISYTLNIKLNV